ncbi:peptidase domain-containing ABC transporter [Yersinia mollaretii]|uniref:peptidase domain-containing ABC transporter n=1 Tax=Yersinia mollaretii TaxID=33060 RepID=UPI0021BD1E6F|nr:peptidase domain-containing ABC transporter [Yersinia mollaretii]
MQEIKGRMHWGWGKPFTLIRQTESSECGLACLAMIAGWYGFQVDLPSLRLQFNISQRGITLQQLLDKAEELNLAGRAVRLEIEDIGQLVLPCILHWDMNHFVVLKAVKGNKLELLDPAKGYLVMLLKDVNRHFTGVALELSPTHAFEIKDKREKVRLTALIGKTQGLKKALVKILCFALTLEIFALTGPLVNQLVIDEVLVAHDSSLLTLIIIAMLLLSSMQVLLSLVKQWAVITMAVNFNLQWTANIFTHLLRLPMAWFETRSIGDISAKFDSVDTIQDTLTTSLLDALLEIILVAGTLSMMLIYSTQLTLITLGTALIYGLLRVFWFTTLRHAAEDSWSASTQESSHFLESLRGVLSLRINGVLAHRESIWRNLNVTRRNANLRESRLIMVYDILHTIIESLTGAAVLWFGASAVLSGQFSVGMLVAYISFQNRFSVSMTGIIDKAFSYRMLDIYNERLADIVLTEREGSIASQNTENCSAIISQPVLPTRSPDEPVLVFNDVTFQYGGSNNEILSHVSLNIMSGEIVALTGASGSGKTTVAKLILGLYQPTGGEIRTLGIAHSQIEYHQTRHSIGVVLQEDQLFQGTIADNITFFAPNYDWERLYACASSAQIQQDIEDLPMGYQTLIGEMGGTLSAGQKQRLLLARALYKAPKLLILDEATSHLDRDNEKLVSQNLRQLGLAILLIAHRPETIASADRVVELALGQLVILR